MGWHAMDQRRGEVNVKDRQEEDNVDWESNQEEGDDPHLDCQHQISSAEQNMDKDQDKKINKIFIKKKGGVKLAHNDKKS